MKFYTTSKISENIHETPEGFLVCIGVPIARTGEMVYGPGETPLEPDEDGRVLIHREAEEVFRPETIASFEGKAVTITHPVDFVDPNNWSRLAKGVLQNVRRGEGEQKDDLIADLLITDAVAINLVKNGLREVSCGYEAEYTQTGEGKGLQTKIVGNHLALVDEGRAGSAYAINDHKGKGTMSAKLIEKLKARFGAKVIDEAMAEEKKESKDESEKKDESKDESAASYDELKKMVADLGEKIDGMGKQKDASSKATENEPAKVDAKDEEVESSLEDRLKALEASVAKLLENQAPASDEESEEGEESEESEDADESEESEDDDFEQSTMVGDTKSRVEILAPGLKAKGKDAKALALKAAYATKDGKAVIDQLTGGKAPELKDEARVNTLFIAASELLKVSRTSAFAGTKSGSRATDSAGESSKGAMTAEQLNAINAKHYGNK